MQDGTHVVPHIPSGRVQVYDSRWKFLRGWAIGARGGDFKVIPAGPDRFDVFPRRSLARDTYRLSGDLVARGKRPPGRYPALPEMGQRYSFPTAPWQLVFVGSFPSWLTTTLGAILLIALKAREARAQTELLRV